MTFSEAREQLQTPGPVRHAAWKYMRHYAGQTPYHGFVVFTRGRWEASTVCFTSDQWHELNLAMWELKAEQRPLFDDLSAQPALFEGGRR